MIEAYKIHGVMHYWCSYECKVNECDFGPCMLDDEAPLIKLDVRRTFLENMSEEYAEAVLQKALEQNEASQLIRAVSQGDVPILSNAGGSLHFSLFREAHS